MMKIDEDEYEEGGIEGFPELTVYENEEERMIVESLVGEDKAVVYRRGE